MRLTVLDPRASQVAAVLLNGKRLPTVIAFDTDEGWAEIAVPKQISKSDAVKLGVPIDINEDPNQTAPTAEWETKRLYGKITILLFEQEKK